MAKLEGSYTAWEELKMYLQHGETLEAVMFGPWGNTGQNEPEPPFIPVEKQNILLTPEQAQPLMQKWSIVTAHGCYSGYGFYAWTNERVFSSFYAEDRVKLVHLPRSPGDSNGTIPRIYTF
jgi:hypothetical protein